jgi:septal ring factor EnvC (AmiA/AmiB activator)
MTTALPTLIIEAEKSAHAVKAAADSFVDWLKSVQADVERCEAELEQKRRAADTEVHRLKMAIEERRKELAKVEQELAQVRKDLERERREIGQERARLLRTVEGVLA